MTRTARDLVPCDTLKPFRDFDAYLIEIDGSVWSCLGTRGKRKTWWHTLKPGKSRQGYPRVNLCKDGKPHQFAVHSLVLEAFVGPKPEGMEGCHHPDPTPSNCHLHNLRWDTRLANQADRRTQGKIRHGERHQTAKVTKAKLIMMYALNNKGYTVRQIAKELSVGESTIGHVFSGTRWKQEVEELGLTRKNSEVAH